MIRLVLFLVIVAALAAGLGWLADRPGMLLLNWQGYEIETTVFRATVMLAFLLGFAVFVWSLFRQIWTGPANVGRMLNRRRQERGMEALSSGMIAVGAGDRSSATRFALQARKSLPNEPLTHLLRAQAAQLTGDRATARRIFEAMLGSPDTEQLGLRGLFLEAQREGETEAARQFAEKALRLNGKLGWPIDALFDLQCRAADWPAALETLAAGRRNGHLEKAVADRRRAVLLTAQAQALEDGNPEKALALAGEAHGLALDLVEAAAIAGRILASRGNTAKAARVIEQTWKRAPHPDLATAYAYARPGDSPRDRLERVKNLARTTPHSIEAPIAIATTAIEARDWAEARKALEPLLESRLQQRVCMLMARVEGEQHGNAGRVREWLARAVNAPRNPAWTADGVVSDRWAPVSPVTGSIDAYQWKVPVEQAEQPAEDMALAHLEELAALEAPVEKVIEARPEPVDIAPAAKSANGSGAGATASAEAPAVAATPASRPATTSASQGNTSVPTPASSVAPATARPTAAEPARTADTGGGKAPVAGANRGEPRIYVPPRAPDDPGPETAVAEEVAEGYRAPMKRPA